MNERELNEIKEQYAKLGDEDANVIHRLVTEVERLKAEKDFDKERRLFIEVKKCAKEARRLRAVLNLIACAAYPVHNDGFVDVETIKDLIEIAQNALKGDDQ